MRTETRATVKLTISEENNPTLERLMPLPEEATGDINAHFVNGKLHLRW
jgi:HSP20 family molecular chaperone IbpA